MPGERSGGSHRPVSQEREENWRKRRKSIAVGEPACAKAGCQLTGKVRAFRCSGAQAFSVQGPHDEA